MSKHQPTPLIDRLRHCATLWSDANGRTLGALSSIVMNHGSFFDRFIEPGASTTTATLERFARYLGDAANWPDGVVPETVCDFVHVVGVTPAVAAPATGQIGELSGGVAL